MRMRERTHAQNKFNTHAYFQMENLAVTIQSHSRLQVL